MDMRAALAESLTHIYSVAAEHMNLGDADVAGGLSEIRAHRVHPGVFGRYYDLVFALQGDRHDDAGALFREIIDRASDRPVFAVLPFSDNALGAADKERYTRFLSLDAESAIALRTPDTSEWTGFA